MAMSQAGSADPSHAGGVGKTSICHIPPGNPANAHTISVGNPAVPAHLAHGDKLGACADTPPAARPCSDNPGKGKSHKGGISAKVHAGKVAVCHIPPGNPANAHTIVIGAPGVPAHLAHGDYLGACGAQDSEVSVDCGGGNDGGNGTGHNGNGGGSGGSDSSSTDDGGNGTGTGTGTGGSGTEGGTVTPPVDSSSNY